MSKIIVHQFPCLQDNYGYLVHVPDDNVTATIDTPDVAAIENALAVRGWTLTHILNTHWHADHAGGNAAIKEKYGVTVIGPRGEAEKIPGIDRAIGEGDKLSLGTVPIKVLDVPGHTLGHIAYWFETETVAFVGDTLFALGCGRVFEGTFPQMWGSLLKLLALPDETLVYCAHEYTAGNAAFAVTIEPDNKELVARVEKVRELRAAGQPTVPSTIGLERRTNPFLRPSAPAIRARLQLEGRSDADVFGEIRTRKDSFRA